MSAIPAPAMVPSSTYRLQFHADFTFRDARAILDYLDDLGISHVYSSPFFQAAPDSTHGYDIADHNRLNPSVGDASDFRVFVTELRQRGLGHILDFVPNHMGIGQSLNAWWMSVLEEGPASPYAHYFDIDWHPGKEELAGKVLLPILGDRYGKVLENGDFKLSYEAGKFFLHYFETRLPLNSRSCALILQEFSPAAENASEGEITAALRALEGQSGKPETFDALHKLLEAQSYRLSYWRVAAEEINYRRFFDINTLAAIRVEIPEVYEAAHQFVFELLARGDVTGLRIDHIDGLWDPRGYLQRLQERYAKLTGRELYLVVEKILDPTREELPPDWPAHGTTGYEFANQAVMVLVDSAAAKRMTRLYRTFTGVTEEFAELVYEKKNLTMQISLSSEIALLGRMLDELSEMHRHFRDFTRKTLTAAVREVIACFPVYRTYTTGSGEVSPQDERVILQAISAARRKNPSLEKPVFDFLRGVLLLRLPDYLSAEQREAHIRFVMKFQQCSGPVTAKGLEDTAFYIYNRLAALNEVGGNPGLFGIEADEFHRLTARRQETFPHALLATSTHDTKRSEDVRLRLAVLSELPGAWRTALADWSKLNKKHRSKIGGEEAPSRNEEYLLYQTLVGSWPLDPAEAGYTERIQQYMLKALKEAKVNSSWVEPNEEWENAVSVFIERILDPALSKVFRDSLAALSEKIAPAGALNSLSQTVLKCTVPGVPDFYQGTEVWDLSLVDPDNRRPVDFELRRKLSVIPPDPAILLQDWKTGAIKLHLIRSLLRFRREQAEFFHHADYLPLEIAGAFSRHLLAFLRRWQNKCLLVVVPRLTAGLGPFPRGASWKDSAVTGAEFPALQNVLFHPNTLAPGSVLPAAELLADFPLGVYFSAS